MSDERKLVVVALGGNAISQANEKGTAEEQFTNVKTTCDELVKMNGLGYKIVVTHGNGPQAGSLLIQQEEGSAQVPAQPLEICGAMTQGQIGYMFQNSLRNAFTKAGKNPPIATLVTQVEVSDQDPDFQDPSKPVGPHYTEEDAKRFQEEKAWIMKKVKPTGEKVWRRVVPSPEPKAIVEIDALKPMIESRVIVIASGGGGVPVVKQQDNTYKGIDAVIDKDKAGNILAQNVGANIFMVLTDVETAFIGYGTPEQRAVGTVTLSEMKNLYNEGHFLSGSMGPKVMAAMRFVEAGGEKAIITSLSKATDALEGKTGTVIIPG
jgi:carbamate kinase